MKITNINSSQSNNINFGYNKKYHKAFQNELRKSNLLISQPLIETDKFLLKLEDELVDFENRRILPNEDFKELSDLLIYLKEMFVDSVTSILPDSDYADNLVKQYLNEIDELNPISPWRYQLASMLSYYTIRDFSKRIASYDTYKSPLKPSSHDTYLFSTQKSNRSSSADNSSKYSKSSSQQSDSPEFKQSSSSSSVSSLSQSSNIDPKLLTRLDILPPRCNLDDVIGLDDLKRELYNDVVRYIDEPALIQYDMENYGVTMPKSILLYGPPGCGKTMITKALAIQTGAPLYRMDISKIGSKYINESSNNLQEAFDEIFAKSQKSDKPIILFLDEIDSIASHRNSSSSGNHEDSKMTSTLLEAMDRAKVENVIIFAATNLHDALDEAIVSRFGEQKYVGLLKKDDIKKLIVNSLSYILKAADFVNDEDALDEVADKLQGYSNRSIVNIIDSACKSAKNQRSDITKEHLLKAIEDSDIEKVNETKYHKNQGKKSIGFSF